MEHIIRITALWQYPVKSCKGVALQQAELGERGIIGDRECMIVTPEGRFITQREIPAMAQIQARFEQQPSASQDGELHLSAPAMEDIRITLSSIATPSTMLHVRIWDDECRAVMQEPAVHAWLSEKLGRDCRLVTMERGFKRLVDAHYATMPDNHTGFADGFHILLIAEESLEALNGRLIERGSEPMPMNRFRPNIVVKGAPYPFAEDSWRTFDIHAGGEKVNAAARLRMHGVKPCGRCVMTTIDQERGIKTGAEPIATLKTFRQSADGKKILFGQNVINAETGIISVGDVLHIHPAL